MELNIKELEALARVLDKALNEIVTDKYFLESGTLEFDFLEYKTLRYRIEEELEKRKEG